ncbi:hypothetical protein XaFJ1_GM000300 [Xanthomonas albilineans]|nr:hypothetical protein XaFJ1_GM000300 [Xanthomonas albilineans]
MQRNDVSLRPKIDQLVLSRDVLIELADQGNPGDSHALCKYSV